MSPVPLLVLSNREGVDRRLVAGAAADSGLCRTYPMSGWRVPAELRDRSDLRLYAEPLFCEATCADLGLALLDAAPDWLARCPRDLLHRNVAAMPLQQAREGTFPAFVKACDDKLGGVNAAVYETADALPDAPAATPVLVSEPVQFDQEVRLFCDNGVVLAGSTYWRDGESWEIPLEDYDREREVLGFAETVLASSRDGLPPAHVLDVGLLDSGQWAVIEANGAWGAGLYAARPDRALQCILASTAPRVECQALPAEVRREPPPAVW